MPKIEIQNEDQNGGQELSNQKDRKNQFARKEIAEPEKTKTIEEIYKKQLQTFQKPPKMPLKTLLISIFISLIVGIIIGFFGTYFLLTKIPPFS